MEFSTVENGFNAVVIVIGLFGIFLYFLPLIALLSIWDWTKKTAKNCEKLEKEIKLNGETKEDRELRIKAYGALIELNEREKGKL